MNAVMSPAQMSILCVNAGALYVLRGTLYVRMHLEGMAVARRQASYLQHGSPYAPAVVLTVRLMKREEVLPEWVASDLSGEQTVREEEEPGLWQYVMVLFPWLGEGRRWHGARRQASCSREES